MDINVTIKCPDLTLAAAALAKAIMGGKETAPSLLTPKTDIDPEAAKAAMQAAPAQIMAQQSTVTPVAPVQAPVAPVQQAPGPIPPTSNPAMTTPAAATTVPTAPAAVPTTPAPQITGDMVAKAGADLIRDDAIKPEGQKAYPKLMALLQKYGVSCAQELRPDQIGPFATEMRALGARI